MSSPHRCRIYKAGKVKALAVTGSKRAAMLADGKEKLEQAGFNPYGSTPAEVEALTCSQYEKFEALSRKISLKAD